VSHFQAALEHHRRGRLADARREYERVPPDDPNHAGALFLLGAIALQSERLVDAVDALSRSVALAPDNAACHSNLGEAYRRLGRPEDAMNALVRAMSLRPDMAEPTYNFGLLLEQLGETAGAIACFERAAELKPSAADIRRRLEDARHRFDIGDYAGRANPKLSARLLVALAQTMTVQGRHRTAASLCRGAIELHPDLAAAHHGLGVALGELQEVDEAVASLRRALALEPDSPDLLSNLGVLLGLTNQVDGAIEAFRRSIALRPSPSVHSNLLFGLHFDPRYDAATILSEARAFDQVYAQPLAAEIRPHLNDRLPERRLRVGYVSPNFRNHCQSLFLVPLLSHHDHRQFEIVCYSAVVNPDGLTQRLLACADRWRPVVGVRDGEIADRIRADQIDILVDLTMHMEQGALGVFARKPAPLQICWLAYPGTTGLAAMDYRVTDPFLDPPEHGPGAYAEQPIHLPDAFWCYDPLTSDPSIGALPARAAGRITFGCLNNFVKVHDGVLELWARVLRELAGSRMVLNAPPGAARGRTIDKLAQEGIEPGRVEFVGRVPRTQYLEAYGRIDICLDTIPYNGHTTSLDAFWMGVPVVTLVGGTVVGRAGLCQAMNLQLPELVATTPDDYVRIAVGLAGDLDHLASLRAGLRTRMAASPLMDAPKFARNLETAYREIWRRRCAGESPAPLSRFGVRALTSLDAADSGDIVRKSGALFRNPEAVDAPTKAVTSR
jgi:protein O-GlcNAc transferase